MGQVICTGGEVLNYLHHVLRPIHLSIPLNLCSSNAYVEQESLCWTTV